MFPHTTCMLFNRAKNENDEDFQRNAENSEHHEKNNSWILCSPNNKNSFIMKIEHRSSPNPNIRYLGTADAGTCKNSKDNNNRTTDDLSISAVKQIEDLLNVDHEEQQVSAEFCILFFIHNVDKIHQ